MQRLIHILALVLISACSFAQTFNWQEISKPYFVYNSKGISIGWDGNVQHTYLIASDLTDIRAYCTLENGAESWFYPERRIAIPGATRVNACRTDGGYAAAIVPAGNPNPGVHFTANGGQSWNYDENDQPTLQNLLFVSVDPTNRNMVYTGGLPNTEEDAATIWLHCSL
jgi:hypothetical protein